MGGKASTGGEKQTRPGVGSDPDADSVRKHAIRTVNPPCFNAVTLSKLANANGSKS
jgi:hypothetical protein